MTTDRDQFPKSDHDDHRSAAERTAGESLDPSIGGGRDDMPDMTTRAVAGESASPSGATPGYAGGPLDTGGAARGFTDQQGMSDTGARTSGPGELSSGAYASTGSTMSGGYGGGESSGGRSMGTPGVDARVTSSNPPYGQTPGAGMGGSSASVGEAATSWNDRDMRATNPGAGFAGEGTGDGRDGDLPTDETVRLISSDKVSGTSVYGRDGERMGTVKHVMIDKRSGKVAYAVMSFGGFLGIGARYHPLPWATLTYDETQDGYVVDLDRSRLEGAPSYGEGDDPDYAGDYGRSVNSYFDRAY
jgi:hypothetical protein